MALPFRRPQESTMSSNNLTALVAVGIAAVALLGAGPVAAGTTTYRDTSGGGACHAASGGAAGSFTYGNNYITNTGTTTQYVICHFGMVDVVDLMPPTQLFQVSISTTVANRTVLCTAQTGAYFAGTNHIASSNARTHTFDAVGDFSLQWDASQIIRTSAYTTFTLNCRMDPGTRVGVIEYWD
jgi:hypothetical protein